MIFHVLTLFPEMFDSFLETSLIARGIGKKIIDVKRHNLRDYATDKHKSVDDRPYGGGPGMVVRVDVVDRGISKLKTQNSKQRTRTILLDPAGKPFTQYDAQRLAKYGALVLIAGHYEGVDERVRQMANEEISIGDYVLTGGELPAMVVIDAVSRMVSGFLGKAESKREESFSGLEIGNSKIENLLEYPQYTRPEIYKGKRVPRILLSGDHRAIKTWRMKQAIQKTKRRRPDLYSR